VAVKRADKRRGEPKFHWRRSQRRKEGRKEGGGVVRYSAMAQALHPGLHHWTGRKEKEKANNSSRMI